MDSLEVKQVFVCLPEAVLKDAVSCGAGCPGGAGRRLAGGSLVPLELFTLSYTKYAASLCQVVLLTGHLKKRSKV